LFAHFHNFSTDGEQADGGDANVQIEQVHQDKEFEPDSEDEEEKPLPDFHGEPVPEDDEDDDALFEVFV
jgi:hypothetical protein